MASIIFGANGQDGYYLGKLLDSLNIEWIGVSRSGNFLRTNISNFTEVENLIRANKPRFVFHFAAQSSAMHDYWKENHDLISTGSINLLEAVRQSSPSTKVFLSGSGLQFNNLGKPIKETDPFEAGSPYALSRIHSTYAARYYRKLGIKAYVGFFFNHDSPRRGDRHVAMKIARVAKNISQGSAEKLELGDLTVEKEWGFAGDAVQAIWLLMQQENIFEANIGTGEAYSIQQWLDICFNLIGKDPNRYIMIKQGYKSEYKILVSDPTLIKSIGWNPLVSINQLAKMMIED